MRSTNTSVSLIENEKQLLRFLCARENLADRQKLCRQLSKYSWRERDHQILFEAIGELLPTAPRQILEQLPAALTRRGFPDISCDGLAGSSTWDAAAAVALAEELLRASH